MEKVVPLETPAIKKLSSNNNYYYEMLYEKCLERDMVFLLKCIDAGTLSVDHYYKNDLGDTTTVFKVSIENKSYVIKRYNLKNIIHKAKLQFRKSHGYRCFHYMRRLNQLGIATLKPLAVIQKRKYFFKLESYFITKYEQGVPGCLYFRDDSLNKSTWTKTIEVILKTTQLLKKNNIYHGDYHFGNFLIVDTIPFLIDFDHVKHYRSQRRFEKVHQEDIANFNRYLMRTTFALKEFKKEQN